MFKTARESASIFAQRPPVPSRHLMQDEKAAAKEGSKGALCFIICVQVLWIVVLVDAKDALMDEFSKLAIAAYFASMVAFNGAMHYTWGSDPGFVPLDSAEEPEPFLRHCGECTVTQPLRAKHCSKCGRCVRRYDHHCFWVGTCVGVRNHARFLLVLFTASVYLGLSVPAVWRSLPTVVAPGIMDLLIVIVSYTLLVISVGMFVFAGCLFVFHVYLVGTAQTTERRYHT